MRLRNIPGAKDVILGSPYVIGQPEACKGKWEQVFPAKQPLHIEVGMGKGRFLMELAALHPDINYVGIEMYSSVLLRALQKMDELKEMGTPLSNLVFLRIDARNLPDIFDDGEVDKIYLNFSDPWPKARHAKRRLTSRQFLARYNKILSKEGTLEFKTDNRSLFDFSLEEVPAAGWQLLACTFDLHDTGHAVVPPTGLTFGAPGLIQQMKDENVMTEYEEKFSSIGNPICKMVIRR